MLYAEARDFLAKHTHLVELSDGRGARVAVAPEWQGRVMTSTCGGPTGPSFGFINHDFIAAGKPDPRFNNYGSEDRMWICPEGGQFSFWFKLGAEQLMDNWRMPSALNEGTWQVLDSPTDRLVRMATHMNLKNASDTTFDLDVSRDVQLLGADDLGRLLGKGKGGSPIFAETKTGTVPIKLVAYETVNRITNRGPALSKKTGLVSIWILGMLNPGPQTVIIFPYKPGSQAELGPAVKADYCGVIPPDRLKITPQAALLRADGDFRSKIGVSPRRARNVLGSIDFQAGVLTIVHFDMPDDPARHDYLNNMFEAHQADPYAGDVTNAYNDGPNPQSGERLGAFYELESISPARELKTGETLLHCHRTIHVQADTATFGKLAQDILGVDLNVVRESFTIPKEQP